LLSVIKYAGSEKFESGITMQTPEEYDQLGQILYDYEGGWEAAAEMGRINQRGGGSTGKQPRKRASNAGNEGAPKKKAVRVTKNSATQQ